MKKEAHLVFRFFLIPVLLFLLLNSPVFSQQTEGITITTYYPSPYGVYNEMRLYPHSPATVGCDASQEGLMYLHSDTSTRELRVCLCQNPPTCSTYAWQSFAGTTAGYWTFVDPNLYPNQTNWNVGIGATTAVSKLHIIANDWYGSGGDPRASLHLQARKPTIFFRDLNQTSPAGEFILHDASDQLQIFRRVTAGADVWTNIINFAGSGNVGIGTPALNNKLEVNGGVSLRNAVFTPKAANPSNWPAGQIGELAYSETEDAFYYYNGSTWVMQGGAVGASYVAYGVTSCAAGWTVAYTGTVAFGVGYARSSGDALAVTNVICMGGSFGTGNPLFPAEWTLGDDRRYSRVFSCAMCVK